MPFQFLCPQGHLLEGNESDMGLECQCPQCGAAFIIPTIEQPAQPAQPSVQSAGQPTPAAYERPRSKPNEALRQLEDAAASTLPKKPAALDDDLLAGAGIGAIVDEPLLHIPCPNGHELETPLDMIGQRAMCPHCGVEFKLRREKSVEYFREQEIIERRQAKFWFQLAVLAAGFVVVVILAMIVIVAVT
ncbi:MAG: hypothetical protein WD845_12120 [Pirellulales bacterium]